MYKTIKSCRKKERETQKERVENKDMLRDETEKSHYFVMLSRPIGLVYECFIFQSLISVVC